MNQYSNGLWVFLEKAREKIGIGLNIGVVGILAPIGYFLIILRLMTTAQKLLHKIKDKTPKD